MKTIDKSAILVRGLSKSFAGQTVLNSIDLEVAESETLAVLGRSGTGKSVLLRLIIGLQKPDAGSIHIRGKEITHMSIDQLNEVRKKVGFLFQEGALYDSLTLLENVEFPLRRHARISGSGCKDRARALLSRVGIEDGLQKLPSQISGGMRKRVGLARALALTPDILLLDEPTAGLDPITAGEIEELILRLQKVGHKSTILVTHDLHGARAVADRVALLHQGNVVTEGTFEDIRKSKDPFVCRFLQQEDQEGLCRNHSASEYLSWGH